MLAHGHYAGRSIGIVLHDHPITVPARDPNLEESFRIPQPHSLPFRMELILESMNEPRTVIATDIGQVRLRQRGR